MKCIHRSKNKNISVVDMTNSNDNNIGDINSEGYDSAVKMKCSHRNNIKSINSKRNNTTDKGFFKPIIQQVLASTISKIILVVLIPLLSYIGFKVF